MEGGDIHLPRTGRRPDPATDGEADTGDIILPQTADPAVNGEAETGVLSLTA